MIIKKQQAISVRGKRRLQVAANFLRNEGTKFDGENFYDVVLKTISELDESRKSEIKSLVDWVEDYEIADVELYGEPLPRSPKNKKQKTAYNKRATRSAPPSAKTFEGSDK
jgi:hypothetical protein